MGGKKRLYSSFRGFECGDTDPRRAALMPLWGQNPRPEVGEWAGCPVAPSLDWLCSAQGHHPAQLSIPLLPSSALPLRLAHVPPPYPVSPLSGLLPPVLSVSCPLLPFPGNWLPLPPPRPVGPHIPEFCQLVKHPLLFLEETPLHLPIVRL